MQRAHKIEAAVPEKRPALHCRQAAELVLPVEDKNVPAGHVLHAACPPWTWYIPAWQLVHFSSLVAAAVVENLPASQAAQKAAPFSA